MAGWWKKIGRVTFHAGALVSVVLATLAGAMWMRGNLIADRWRWVATEARDRGWVQHEWSVDFNGGRVRLLRFLAFRLPEEGGITYGVTRFQNQFQHQVDLPGAPPSVLLRIGAQLVTAQHEFIMTAQGGVAWRSWAYTDSYYGSEWGMAAPLWGVVAVLALWPACWEFLYRRGLYRRARERWRRERLLCVACGYDVRATPGQCPECGTVGAGVGGEKRGEIG